MKRLCVPLLCVLLLFSACGLQAEDDESYSAAFTIRPRESLTERYFDVPLSTQADADGIQRQTSVPDDAETFSFTDLRNLLMQSMFAGNPNASATLWTQQIRYAFNGDASQEDRDALTEMAADLMQITAFPGMRETEEKTANVIVHFADVQDAQFSYTRDANGACTGGQITIPSALPSWQRQALLCEKMFRLFGFFHEAETTLDSILSEQPASYMTEADLILLDVVYAQMQPGMSRDACLQQFDAHFLGQEAF